MYESAGGFMGVELSLSGRGAGGDVYSARDVQLEHPLAIKFLRSARASSPWRIEPVLREARAASALNHNGRCPAEAFPPGGKIALRRDAIRVEVLQLGSDPAKSSLQQERGDGFAGGGAERRPVEDEEDIASGDGAIRQVLGRTVSGYGGEHEC